MGPDALITRTTAAQLYHVFGHNAKCQGNTVISTNHVTVNSQIYENGLRHVSSTLVAALSQARW